MELADPLVNKNDEEKLGVERESYQRNLKKAKHSQFSPMAKTNGDKPRCAIENGRGDGVINTKRDCQRTFPRQIFYSTN